MTVCCMCTVRYILNVCVCMCWCAGMKLVICIFWLVFLWAPEFSRAPWIQGVPHVTMSSRDLKGDELELLPFSFGHREPELHTSRKESVAARIEDKSRISRIFIWILCRMPVTLRMRWSESSELVETGHLQPPFYGSAWQQHCDCWGSCRQFCCETFALESPSLL